MEKNKRKLVERAMRAVEIINSHHTGAYAAQSAYFFVLSLIPIIILLMTMVQFTPVTEQDVMEAVLTFNILQTLKNITLYKKLIRMDLSTLLIRAFNSARWKGFGR